MCITLKINMSQESGKEDNDMIDIIQIVKDVENGELGINEILEKHKITLYKYNQILKLAELKKTYVRTKKITKFKKMIIKSEIDINNDMFNKEGFIGDCKGGLKISELMEKYNLSLYQVRELRKKYDLKTK